jgi:uncharacterized protein (TIGR02246 family)
MASMTIDQEILGLEKEYWRAIQDRDVEAARRLTDERCILAGSKGVRRVDWTAFEAMMKDPRHTLLRFELDDDAQAERLGDDVAVLAYHVHEELTVEGQPLTLDAAESSTWTRRGGRWRCAMHAESIFGDPFGRDRQAAADDLRPSVGSDRHAIRGLIQAWLFASQAGDLEKVLALMADDVVFLVPGREPFGKEEFARTAAALKDVRLEAQSEVEEIAVMGDWAWCRTHLSLAMHPPGGEATRRSGHTLSILKRTPDGGWHIARDANLLVPEPQPLEAVGPRVAAVRKGGA